MGQFSMKALQVIDNFAASMGLPAIPASDGSFGFVIDHVGTLSLVASDVGRRVIVGLDRIPFRSDTAMERNLLDLAGFDPTTSTFAHAGMASDGTMILAVDFDEDRFDLQSLDYAVERLTALHDSVS
jgi:hypothetical protein